MPSCIFDPYSDASITGTGLYLIKHTVVTGYSRSVQAKRGLQDPSVALMSGISEIGFAGIAAVSQVAIENRLQRHHFLFVNIIVVVSPALPQAA